ncbi:hypothetical protein BT69DRAFT_537112 [Atractiella rhizophila]|nr:hypothetical protein BT69DRAFT_537112 [Atractiella rhizophila]
MSILRLVENNLFVSSGRTVEVFSLDSQGRSNKVVSCQLAKDVVGLAPIPAADPSSSQETEAEAEAEFVTADRLGEIRLWKTVNSARGPKIQGGRRISNPHRSDSSIQAIHASSSLLASVAASRSRTHITQLPSVLSSQLSRSQNRAQQTSSNTSYLTIHSLRSTAAKAPPETLPLASKPWAVYLSPEQAMFLLAPRSAPVS